MKIDNAILNNSQLLSISVSKAYEGGVFCPIFSTDGKYVIFPGLCDVHVHLREPGFSYKETIKTGTMAAARGGYSTVCSMPNLNPVPDSAENLQKQLDIIERDMGNAFSGFEYFILDCGDPKGLSEMVGGGMLG